MYIKTEIKNIITKNKHSSLFIFAFLLVSIFFIFTPAKAYAANQVFYSVGQSASDLSNNGSSQACSVGGDCTVTISSGVATFNFAQTGNIGVGDVMVANGVSYYIAGKTSQLIWNVVTNTGATPADISSTAVTSIKRVYTSLSMAVTNASTLLGTNDLTSGPGYILNIPCYYDSGPDTTPITVSGYTASATNYIKIYTPNNVAT